MNNKIAIVIPDHNDPFLIQTIKSAVANAKYPENLYFSVFSTNNDFDQEELKSILNVNIVQASSDAPLGTGISRLVAAYSRVHDCEYHLQIDTHTIFAKNWDDLLLNYYKSISSEYGDDIVISAATQLWSVNDGVITIPLGEDRIVDPYNFELGNIANGQRMKLFVHRFPNGGGKRVQSSSDSDWVWGEKDYVEQHTLIGHFIFAKDRFFTEFIHDPLLGWYGDQEGLAVRSWTRGYRFFAIKTVPVFTQRKTESDIANHPRDHRHELNKIKKESGRTSHRYATILNGELLGYWGAKDMESLKAWEQANGVSFIGYLNGND